MKLGISGFGNRSTGTISFRDEDRRQCFIGIFSIGKMISTVTKFFIVNIGFFGAFFGYFSHAFHIFSLAFAGLYFFEQYFCYCRIFMQIVIQMRTHKFAHKCLHCGAFVVQFFSTQLCFGLRFKKRFLNPHTNTSHNTHTNICCIKIFFIKISDRPYDGFFKSVEMRTALRSVLPIDKGIIFFAIFIGMGKCYFYIAFFQMNGRIMTLFFARFFINQIFESVS